MLEVSGTGKTTIDNGLDIEAVGGLTITSGGLLVKTTHLSIVDSGLSVDAGGQTITAGGLAVDADGMSVSRAETFDPVMTMTASSATFDNDVLAIKVPSTASASTFNMLEASIGGK